MSRHSIMLRTAIAMLAANNPRLLDRAFPFSGTVATDQETLAKHRAREEAQKPRAVTGDSWDKMKRRAEAYRRQQAGILKKGGV